MTDTRTEKDSMGDMQIPADALYGASTQRAVINFPISGKPVNPAVICAYGLIKAGAAAANCELGKLHNVQADAIIEVATAISEGQLAEHFPVDVYQTGSGTSTNMNVNEVIANRCSQIAGKIIGSRDPVHPNDHVNMGQSSNDTFPSAIHIATVLKLRDELIPELGKLADAFDDKASDWDEVIKIGRTHTMDATPVTLGQEFRGYGTQLSRATAMLKKSVDPLRDLALGGTAVGTGINTDHRFAKRVIGHINIFTGESFREAPDHFAAQGAKDELVALSGALKTIATALFKISNDLRWLSSGPRCAIGEIKLPATQPGSSIMPGKVNPVIAEAMMMVAARVIGNDATITWAGANGNFELNVMMPVLADAVLESIDLLTNASKALREKCVEGIEANEERCKELVELSLSMVTSLAPIIGYDKAAKIAKQSVETGKTVRVLCQEQHEQLGLSSEELKKALDPMRMTRPDED